MRHSLLDVRLCYPAWTMALALWVSELPAQTIYWTEYWPEERTSRILRAGADGGDVEVVLEQTIDQPVTVVVDQTNGHIYWTDSDRLSIQRANLDGSDVVKLVSTGPNDSPFGLALDIAGGKIYWTQQSQSGGALLRADLDGQNIEELAAGGTPTGLALDLAHAQLYYEAYGGLYRANLDGSRSELLFSGVGDWFVLDLAAEQVYWTIHGNTYCNGGKIRRADLDGSGVTDVVTGLHGPRGIALDLQGGKLYWTQDCWPDPRVRRANLDGSNVQDVVSGLVFPRGVTVEPLTGQIYWANHSVIGRAELDGGNLQTILQNEIDVPRDIQLDPLDHKMYWIDTGHGSIRRANFDGSDVEHVTDWVDLNFPSQIALGIPSRQVYWAFPSDVPFDGSIQRCGFDGSDVEDVIQNLNDPNGIALDLPAGKVYWTSGLFVGGPQIQCADLDSPNVTTLVTGSEQWRDIALHSYQSKMYWCSPAKIQRANLDGSNVEDVVTGLTSVRNIALDVPAGKIYWTDDQTPAPERVYRANLDGTDIEEILLPGSSRPWGIALDLTPHPIADCADLDRDGIRDDACVWWQNTGHACVATEIIFADMGGPDGRCAPDGTSDAHDKSHALNCFSNLGPIGYPCELSPPTAYNVDAAGLGTPCAPDGVCDANDAFAALNAWMGTTTCRCPSAGAAPEEPSSSFERRESAKLVLESEKPSIQPGELVRVDAYLAEQVTGLQGYQLHVAASGGRHGALELLDIAIEDRPDFVFAGVADTWRAFNLGTAQLLAGVDTVPAGTPAGSYLATFTYRASPDAAGTFLIEFRVSSQRIRPQERTFLFEAQARPVQVSTVLPAAITVDKLPRRAGRHRDGLD